MANFAQLMKDEIRRLARKEIKEQVESLRKASSNYRSEIASLKRQVASLERDVARLQKNNAKASPAPAADEASANLRFQAKGLRSHRQKLGLSAADYGQLVGVSAITIYSWESEKTKPRKSQLPAIATVRTLGKREATRKLDELAAG